MNHRPMEGQFDRKIPWNLKEVIGKPASSSFWRDNSIGKFAISHRIVHGDTVASLAVKYSVQVGPRCTENKKFQMGAALLLLSLFDRLVQECKSLRTFHSFTFTRG